MVGPLENVGTMAMRYSYNNLGRRIGQGINTVSFKSTVQTPCQASQTDWRVELSLAPVDSGAVGEGGFAKVGAVGGGGGV